MPYLGQGLSEGRRFTRTYTATASQTTFAATYDPGFVDVYQNGVRLFPDDFTATNGSEIVLAVGASASDEITIVSHNTFSQLGVATQTDIDTAISNLVDSSPASLDTLNELAAALGDDPNFATTVTTSLAGKVDEIHTGDVAITGNLSVTYISGDGSQLTNIAVGASGGGSDQIFWENDQTVTTDYSINSSRNAMTAGPININSGVTVTIPSGSTWTIV